MRHPRPRGLHQRLRHLWRERRPWQPRGGNEVVLYEDGDECFEAMWSAIDAATESIWLETYALEPDAVGLETLLRLAAAARRGLEVILIYDHVGSAALRDGHLAPLRACGGQALVFNPVWPWRRQGPWVYRDHRKLLLIDGRTAFVGGRNIGQRYAGARLGHAVMDDLQARITGPAVRDLLRLFRATLRILGQPRRGRLPPAPAPAGHVTAQVLPANARHGQRLLQRRLRRAIGRAQHSIDLITPYFLPSARLLTRLRAAARRNVRVRVLVPRESDLPFIDLARRHLYRALLRSGVEVYETPARLHTKAVIIDGHWGLIGSFNMDRYTGAHNLEVGLALHDTGLCTELAAGFQRLARDARLLEGADLGASWPRRLLQWASFITLNVLTHSPSPPSRATVRRKIDRPPDAG